MHWNCLTAVVLFRCLTTHDRLLVSDVITEIAARRPEVSKRCSEHVNLVLTLF